MIGPAMMMSLSSAHIPFSTTDCDCCKMEWAVVKQTGGVLSSSALGASVGFGFCVGEVARWYKWT